MSQKHQLLHELLQEDQEPFHLKNYISDRRCQLKKHNSLQVKKRNPISSTFQTSNFTCKNPCFFALTNCPNPTKSPLPIFDLRSPSNKSPCSSRNTPNAIFLHASPKTSSLLLEAAVRIQKQSKNKKPNGFGLFGSLFKKLSSRNSRKHEIITTTARQKQEVIIKTNKNTGSGCSRNGRRSCTIWSGSSEEKCLDLELESFRSSSSGGDSDSEVEIKEEFGVCYLENNNEQFCESPFNFVLLRSPASPGRRTPDFTSPVTSPTRQKAEDKTDTNVGSSLKFQVQAEEEEGVEKEDKEQFSPVSVLDPPFEDDDDGCYEQMEDDGFDLECSYAIVQRVKKRLLQKLHRFEKLAGLDPVELEKRMLDQEEVDHDDLKDDIDTSSFEEEADGREDEELDSSNEEKNIDMFIIEEVSRSSFNKLVKMPKDMKRLVSDLIDEEEKDQSCFANGKVMAKRVCKRFESWKDVESNTIDMMVEQDFKRENEEWKRFHEQVEEAALQIELDIFGLLMEELTDELVVLTGIL